MEANFGGEGHQFFAAGSSNRYGKKTLEWDLNDWKWDGDLFVAAPVNPGPLNCLKKQLFPEIVLSNSSSSCSDEAEFGLVGKVPGEEDKRRRIVVAEDDERCDDTQSLTLKLGAQAYPVMEKDLNFIELKNRKRGMVETSNSNYPKCQAENCSADLSQSKDYHRRHKVCEMHAKAGSAIVRNAVQRFCQQCSRFHLLQEFDEGKRSCRRRLAGHNKRRRKILSDASPSGSTAAGDQSAGYLLISLLRIIANLNSDRSEQSNDQEFLSNLLKNIASFTGSSDGNNISGLHQVSHDLQKVGTSTDARTSGAVPIKENIDSVRSPPKTVCDPHAINHCASPAITDHCASPAVTPREIHGPQKLTYMLPNAGASKKGFDLNTMYYEEDGVLGCRKIASQTALDIRSSNFPSWMLHDFHQSSPPQTSANTDSTSNQSPSSSNGDAQGRTDRIVFKLFGKDPNDFPLGLRAQIFNWLSSSPADMESYIRPGCIILTVYFRLEMSMWDELCHDFGSTLKKLLSLTDDNFWRIGWIYARLQHYFTFIYNGQVVLNRSLIMERSACGRILSITPIAVPPSSTVIFKVKCSNLVRSASRLLCAIEGKYLIQETNQNPIDHFNSTSDRGTDEHLEFLSFSCCIPNTIGRGFIEIEDNGLSSDFFPFMVAEEDLCTEIQVLESSIASSSEDKILESERSMALNFLNEMGWLLHRTSLRPISGSNNICSESSFSLSRFRWILRFSIDRNWSAVVKKLLDILFEGRCIETAGSSPSEVASSEGLLHYAVQKKADSTIKLLLRYKSGLNNLFRPDMLGPAGITPLHVAASSSLAESTLDILTDDPGQFGMKAWSNARDNAGFTPEEYARAGGRESYVLLMRKKIGNVAEKHDAVLTIPTAKFSLAVPDRLKSGQPPRGAVKKTQLKQLQPPLSCRLCEQRSAPRSSLLYRPMLLSMVGIAAVCVCVGLLFKGPPEVIFVYPPFRWELLESGYI